MAPNILIAEVIELGFDISSIKIYAIAVIALWLYDYFLTLEDEVAYAWKTKNMLMFVLFLITRYLPVPFFIWIIASSWLPSYTAELCRKTVFLEVTYFTLITLFAHIVLTLRVYAITGGNKWIAGGLYGLSIIQFGVGAYLCVYSSLHPLRLPPIPLEVYQMCLFRIPRFGSLLYTSFSLAFDLAVFVIILVRTRVSGSQRGDSNIPNIINTVTRDAVIYFSVIFTSHFLLVLMLRFVRPSLRFLPTVGNAVFVPMMITRIILSLKKAASTPPKFEMVEVPTEYTVALQDLEVLRYDKDNGTLPHQREHVRPPPGLSPV